MEGTTPQVESSPERDLLATCGLNPTEQSILLFLLQQGRGSAGIISKRTTIKRPTVYSALVNLEAQGLVARQKVGSIVYYSAVSAKTIPLVLKNRARQKFQQIEAATNLLEAQLTQVSSSPEHHIGGYEITVLESIDAVYGLLENALTSGNYCGIFNPQTAFQGPGKEMTRRFLKKASVAKPWIREIAVQGPLCDWYQENINNPNHELRLIEEDQNMPMDFILLNDAAIVTQYCGDTANALLIRHHGFCMFMQMLFDNLWRAHPG